MFGKFLNIIVKVLNFGVSLVLTVLLAHFFKDLFPDIFAEYSWDIAHYLISFTKKQSTKTIKLILLLIITALGG